MSGVVVTRLYGGLGNQMFQYAAGLAVARRLGARLYVDTSWFEPRAHPRDSPPIRRYGLDAFGIPAHLPLRQRARLRLRPPAVVRERASTYQPDLALVGGSVVLDGYWQSERYFEGCEDAVRRAFTFAPPGSEEARRLLDEILATGSVSVHVRRGDYESNPKHRTLFGLLGPDHYAAAASELCRRRGEDLRFYVFSDDIAWCRGHLELPGAAATTFVTDTGTDVEDLMLMAACRDHVIANSSFSWWGAWLGNAPDKLVVAPLRWANDPAVESADRIPPGWIRL